MLPSCSLGGLGTEHGLNLETIHVPNFGVFKLCLNQTILFFKQVLTKMPNKLNKEEELLLLSLGVLSVHYLNLPGAFSTVATEGIPLTIWGCAISSVQNHCLDKICSLSSISGGLIIMFPEMLYLHSKNTL